MNEPQNVLFWHRRDLRMTDNAGLYKALKSGNKVQAVFIFDETILEQLPENDQRVLFIHREITALKLAYQQLGSDLIVLHGNPLNLIPQLAQEYHASTVFINRDYEPAALERDQLIQTQLQELGILFVGSKDHVIFEKNEILKADNTPYTIFTPYMRRWKEQLTNEHFSAYPTADFFSILTTVEHSSKLPTLAEMGFSTQQRVDFPSKTTVLSIIENYAETRDIPAIHGTSRLSLHLRFGTISIRELVGSALTSDEKFLNELIWRDFYQMILFHFPYSIHSAFKPTYNRIQWEHNDAHFNHWCEGTTGYPLVDAGMRELNATGHMHNRVRMVVASFLTKHLLIDWRLGERYFALKLLDFELASNVGGWQWAAGCGCDAAPYFRVFNPTAQQQKFDPSFIYIRKWVPEFGTPAYPEPIIDHKMARERVLARYKEALGKE